MKNTHAARHVLLLIFSFLFLFCFQTTLLQAADNKIIILKEITINSIGIKKAYIYSNEDGIIYGIFIIEVDKQGPLRWMMRDTRIMSITWRSQTIRLDEWSVLTLELIKDGQEIFVHFLLPGETDDTKIETRQVDIRFNKFSPPDYTDYSSP